MVVKFNLLQFLKGFIWAFVVALVVACVMTWLDWKANPSELFHDANGTHWDVVIQTLRSWQFPLWMLFLALSYVDLVLHRLVRG